MKSSQKELNESELRKGYAFPLCSYSTLPSPTHYHFVSWKEAQQNKEYKQLTQNMFQEQAARIIQRAWRKFADIEFKGKYVETLNGNLSLKFLKETLDDKYKEHAKKINDNQWFKVDYYQAYRFLKN